MIPMNMFLIYVITLVCTIAIDFVWLISTIERLYRKNIGHLMAEQAQLLPVAIFYCLFVLGLMVFIIVPSINQKIALRNTLLHAGLFGMITYATYDLTNLATLKDWPVFLTVIDIMWGAFLTTTASFFTIKIINFLGLA